MWASRCRGGGDAVPEDAISFRAYKETGNNFALIVTTDPLPTRNKDCLTNLRANALPVSPITGEFWFIALAEVPPQRPPTIAIRLYAFDGYEFRTIWEPQDIIAEGPEEAVELANAGFTVNRLFDPTGQAAHSPTAVIHEQYTVTAEGPRKVAEWRTDRQ